MSIKKIKSFYKSITTNYLLKRFFAASGKEIGNGKKILIYAGIGHMYISYFEILMYHLLKREGYEVDYLIYDEHIRSNEVITKEVIQKSGKIKFWNRSVKNAVSLLKRAKVDFEFIDANLPMSSMLLYFTDGEGIYPKIPPSYEVLWALSQNRARIPFGRALLLT